MSNPPKSMSGHGTFIYNAAATISRYGSPESVAFAVKELNMQHVWVRIHGAIEMPAIEPTLSLVQALQKEDIGVAGWGWCQGDDVSKEAKLAINALNQFGLTDYVADIEHGVSGAYWTRKEIKKFFSTLRQGLSEKSKVALSTHAFVTWHGPELMQEADLFVDYFAPQIYWFWYPSAKMLKVLGVSDSDYPLNDPASYMRLCILLWRKITQKPLIAAGQTYWGEAEDFTKTVAENKLQSFISVFDEWESLQGLNWWHLGGKSQDAMSFSMFNAIKEAELNSYFGG